MDQANQHGLISEVLRHEMNERATRLLTEAKEMLAKSKRVAAMMRKATTKVVVVVHRCVNATRRVRSVRRPTAKKAGSKSNSSNSDGGDGPAGPCPFNFFQQLHQQYPSRAVLAQVVLGQGAT